VFTEECTVSRCDMTPLLRVVSPVSKASGPCVAAVAFATKLSAQHYNFFASSAYQARKQEAAMGMIMLSGDWTEHRDRDRDGIRALSAYAGVLLALLLPALSYPS
jgi:hypothetical protein